MNFSSDGARAITGADDETVRLWNAADGKLIAEMKEHNAIRMRESKNPEAWSGNVETVAFSPDDKIIASGSNDGRVLLWDGNTGAFSAPVRLPGRHGRSCGHQVFELQPGREMAVASAASSKAAKFMRSTAARSYGTVTSGTSRENSSIPSRIPDAAMGQPIVPMGTQAVAAYNSSIQILEPRTGKLIRTLESSGTTIFAASFAKDGRSIAWGTDVAAISQRNRSMHHRLMYSMRLPFGGAPLVGPEPINQSPSTARSRQRQ